MSSWAPFWRRRVSCTATCISAPQLSGFPWSKGRSSQELPIVCSYAEQSFVDEMIGELADMFGLSEPFLRVRLRRYGLVPGHLLG